ncbi:hypothetical protein GCM10023178_53210 [Actinomadura luteofluorescens]
MTFTDPSASRAPHGFRRWRRTRPFWGGVFAVLGGVELVAIPLAPMPLVVHQGLAGVASWLIGALLVTAGALMWLQPAQRSFYGILAVLLSLASFLTSNFGGFLVGMLLGLLGGALGFAWSPAPDGPRPDAAPRVERLRFTVPPGATRMAVDVRGELLEATLDGEPLAPAPEMPLPGQEAPPGRTAELRIRTHPGHRAGAALAGPVRFTVGPGTIELGDWEEAGLAGYSGAVRYRRSFRLAAPPSGAALDLGRVRGTAEVTVNGEPAGVRICAPYRFDVGASLREGGNEIEILVCGTLAPYLDEVSPTHFVFQGQRASGLFGPVRLLMEAPAAGGR